MPRKLSSQELTAFGNTDIEQEIRFFLDAVLKQEKITTMDKKLIVEAATLGRALDFVFFGFV